MLQLDRIQTSGLLYSPSVKLDMIETVKDAADQDRDGVIVYGY